MDAEEKDLGGEMTPARGKDVPRPILEAGLVFAAFWLAAYLPGDGSAAGASLASPLHHLGMIAGLLPKGLLLLYLMAHSDGLAAFGGITRPRFPDLFGALAVAAGAMMAVILPSTLLSLLSTLLGSHVPLNPLLSALARPSDPAYILVPILVLDCLCIGYTEELFFRIYFLRRLGQAGLRPIWAGVVSVLLFASAHGAQGWLGLLMAAVLGTWFTWRRLEGANLHELGLGHGLYDTIVLLATLYLGT